MEEGASDKARSDLIEERVSKLTKEDFGRYVRVYDEQVSFTTEQLSAHRICISLRRQAGSVQAAVDDPQFLHALRRTLRAWGIGIQGIAACAGGRVRRCTARRVADARNS